MGHRQGFLKHEQILAHLALRPSLLLVFSGSSMRAWAEQCSAGDVSSFLLRFGISARCGFH